MKRLWITSTLIASTAVMAPTVAQAADMQGMDSTRAAGSALSPSAIERAQGLMAHGVINSVNLQAGTVNVTHHAIPALGWPGMTMDFAVQDKAALPTLKPGQQVDFDLRKLPSGSYVISRLRLRR